MKHTQEILGMALIAHNKSPEILEPSKEPFDFPASVISPQTTPILSFILTIGAVGRDHFDSILSQLSIQFVGIVSIIADQVLRSFGDDHRDKRGVDKFHLVRRGAFNA